MALKVQGHCLVADSLLAKDILEILLFPVWHRA